MTEPDHRCFTVAPTSYLRHLTSEDKNSAIAIYYQSAPKKHDDGTTSFSMNIPILILSGYLSDQRAVAEKIAAILEKHWSDDD